MGERGERLAGDKCGVAPVEHVGQLPYTPSGPLYSYSS